MACHAHSSFVEAIRNTWLPLVPKGKCEVKFFFGAGATRSPQKDEVFLNCEDDYNHLPKKVQSIFRYAYDQGYDFVFKLDCDVLLKPEQFFSYNFIVWDYIGGGAASDGSPEVQRTPWGFCYMLSKRALEIILRVPLPEEENSTHDKSCLDYAFNDEYWVANILHQHGIYLHVDPHYHLRTEVSDPNSAWKERVLPEGVSAICVHIHQEHSRPISDSVKEFYRLAEEHLVYG